MNAPPALPRRAWLPLVFILLLGAGLRLLYLQTPLLDAHRWRQVDTAAIARNFHEIRFNIFYPQVDWGGPEAYVETEFPLLPALTAALYRIFGQQDYLGRVVAVVFSIATIVAMFGLARELLGPGGGLAAAFLLAVSPAAAYFGRTFMPDALMLFFWVSGVWGFVRYFKAGSRKAVWLGSAATGLACLTKIPAVMMLAPIAAAAWHFRGWSAVRDRAFLLALAVPLAATAAWYYHAYTLYDQTGLTFGILVHPAKTYPLTIAPGPWLSTFSKWSTPELLTDSGFYITLLGRLHHFYLLPWGLAGALLGFVLWPLSGGRLVADAWLLALVAFVLVAGQGNLSHDYYQLPIVPAGALYFGAVAGAVFDGSWRPVQGRGLARAVVLTIVAIVGFYYSGVVNSHFRPDNLDVRLWEAGQATARVVPEDALVVVTDDYGVTSPLLLYFAHRKGWSFDVENLNPHVLEHLRRKGARYFVSTVWPRVVSERPEAAAYLQLHPQMELHGAPRDTVVFDLSGRR